MGWKAYGVSWVLIEGLRMRSVYESAAQKLTVIPGNKRSANDLGRLPIGVPSEKSLLHLWWSRSSKFLSDQVSTYKTYIHPKLCRSGKNPKAPISQKYQSVHPYTAPVEDSLTKSLLPRGKGFTNRFFNVYKRLISLKSLKNNV